MWQVVEWVLAPVRVAWSAPDWPQHLASPPAFYAHYVDIQQDAQGRPQVCSTHRCVKAFPPSFTNVPAACHLQCSAQRCVSVTDPCLACELHRQGAAWLGRSSITRCIS